MPTNLRKYYSNKTHATRMAQLVTQVNTHDHRAELLSIMQDQQMDDKFGHMCQALPYFDDAQLSSSLCT